MFGGVSIYDYICVSLCVGVSMLGMGLYVHACVWVSLCEGQGDLLGDLLRSKGFLRT